MGIHINLGRGHGKSIAARLMAEAQAIRAGRAVFRVGYASQHGMRVEELGPNGKPVIDAQATTAPKKLTERKD